MTTDLQDQKNNAMHLLRQVLDEEVGPVRTDLTELKNARSDTQQIVERLTTQVLELEKSNHELAVKLNRPGLGGYDSPDTRADRARASKAAFQKALIYGGIGKLTPEERQYIRLDSEAGIVSGAQLGHSQDDEYKTMYASLAETGGFLMTPEVSGELIEAIVLVSDMRSLVNVRKTSKPWVSIRKRTQTTSAVRVAEQATRTETQNLKFGMVQVFPYESYALTIISRQDLDDSDLDLAAYLNADFSQQFGVLVGREILNGKGAGAGECNGILTNTTITGAAFASTVAASFAYADLASTVTSLKSGYRKGASWIMRTETMGVLMGMTNTQGTPLIPAWTSGPATLFGYPINEMPDMPALAANAYAMGFGNWKLAYEFVERTQVSIQVLVEYYANLAAIGYMAYYRFGGDVKLAEAIKLLKCHA